MQRCSVFVMVAAGIVLGVGLFLLRRTLSASGCKRCGILKREFFLSAAIVSSLLSYMALCASSVMAKEKDGPTAQEASPTTATNLQALKQSKEWQDLKVLWNLITGDLEFLQDDLDDGRMRMSDGLPRWKATLLLAVVDHRIKQLDRLVNQGVLSVETSHAIASLFREMLSHVARSNSNATCYAMSAEGGRWSNAIYSLESQMREIRKLSKAGTLNDSVIRIIEKQLKEKLTVLDILGEWPISTITEEEMKARIQQWRKQGKINARWMDGSISRQITEEILKERQNKLSGDERARRQAAWQQDQQTVLNLTVDLACYAPNRVAEKEIIKEFSGDMAQARLLECLKTANRYEKKELITGLGEIGGTDAVPLLKEQLNDKTLDSFSHSSPDTIDPKTRVDFVAYSVRDQAIDVLKELGVETPEKSERKAESPEGRAMVREALESKDLEVMKSGLWAAGITQDKSLISRLKDILSTHPSLRENVLRALGQLGDATSLPLIMSAAEEGADPETICSALEYLGTKEALEYLQKRVSVSKDPLMRRIALYYLSEKKEAGCIPLFREALKDGQLSVRLQAALALQQLDCNDGFAVFVEASKAGDPELMNEAMRGLSQSKDPHAAEYLKTYDQPSDGEGEDQARLALIDKGGADALKVLEDALNGSRSEKMVRALLRIGRTEAEVSGLEEVLIRALTRENKDVCGAAISALRDKGTITAISPLLDCLQAHNDDSILSYDATEAIKAIRERNSDAKLGSFLADLTSTDPIKLQEANKRKSNLSFADLQALIAAIGDDKRPDQEKQAANKILKEKGVRCVGPIIQSLSEQPADTFVHNSELMELLDDHMDETIRQVMAFIGDPSRHGRANVMAILKGGWPNRKQYPLKKMDGLKELLMRCTSDKDRFVRANARILLIKMDSSGDTDFDSVLEGLADATWVVQSDILSSFNYKDKPFTPEQRSKIASALVLLLKDQLESSSEDIFREHATEVKTKYIMGTMEGFADKEAIPVLQKMLKQGEPDRKGLSIFLFARDNLTPVQLAAKLLYSLSDEQTIPFWKEIASGHDEVLALWAHAALYKFNQDKDEHLKQMGMLLRDTRKRSVRSAGKIIIKSLDEKACVPLLREYLGSNNGSTVKSVKPTPRVSISSDHDRERQEAFKQLVDIGGEDVLEDVKRIFLADRDGYLRRDAVDYLIALAGNDAVPLLLQGLQDPSPGVRYHICEVIWLANREDSKAALKKVAEEDPYHVEDLGFEVRDEAKAALRKMKLLANNDMQETLIEEAKNIQSNLRGWAIERLGEIRDEPAVVEALKTLLKDPYQSSCCGRYHIREAAAEALRKLGKKVIDKGDSVFELQQ